MRMKAQDKATWVAALRSDKHEQCQGHLTDGMGYCCLGVMQKVLDPQGRVESDLGLPSPQWCMDNGIRFDNEDNCVEGDIAEVSDDDMNMLAKMNDGYSEWVNESVTSAGRHVVYEPKTFTEIADYIEKNIETY